MNQINARAVAARPGTDNELFIVDVREPDVPRPSNYVEIGKANLGRPDTPGDLLQALELGPNRPAAS